MTNEALSRILADLPFLSKVAVITLRKRLDKDCVLTQEEQAIYDYAESGEMHRVLLEEKRRRMDENKKKK